MAPIKVEAIKRWARAVGNLTPFQRERIIEVCEENAALRGRVEALEGGAGALLAALHGWDAIWMQWQKGYVTDAEYIALRALGGLIGDPDPHVIPAFPDPLTATEQSDGGRREREREDVAIFRDAAMLLACLTDYVEGESISAQVWYQEFFWAIADIQKRVAEIEPDYTDAALMILRRANERYPYRMRHQAAPDGAGMPESGASGEDGD